MYTENFLLLFFSIMSLIFCFFVIFANNPIYSILNLILVFFNVSCLLIFLNAEFLAFLFIIVYVGAVAVLFLFVIMMLNIKFNNLGYKYLFLSVIFGFISLFELFNLLYKDLIPLSYDVGFLVSIKELPLNFFFNWNNFVSSVSNISIFGSVLYTQFSFPFILAGFILLIAMLGSISLTLHKRSDVKRQYVYKQIQRNFNNTINFKD